MQITGKNILGLKWIEINEKKAESKIIALRAFSIVAKIRK
jgi:hypothetical protein